MRVDGTSYRTIWASQHAGRVSIIDQTRLPHEFVVAELATLADAAEGDQATCRCAARR